LHGVPAAVDPLGRASINDAVYRLVANGRTWATEFARRVHETEAVLRDRGLLRDIELRTAENMRYEMTPHPVEHDMYYSV
jgi:hypothetical protein